jgi:hypothetical protein
VLAPDRGDDAGVALKREKACPGEDFRNRADIVDMGPQAFGKLLKRDGLTRCQTREINIISQTSPQISEARVDRIASRHCFLLNRHCLSGPPRDARM